MLHKDLFGFFPVDLFDYIALGFCDGELFSYRVPVEVVAVVGIKIFTTESDSNTALFVDLVFIEDEGTFELEVVPCKTAGDQNVRIVLFDTSKETFIILSA